MNNPHCKCCKIKFKPFFQNAKKLDDLDFTRIGYFCTDCFPAEEEKIKSLRFVEEYKNNNIYCKDGFYAPYWHSHYCFDSIEGARDRIDNSHMAYGVNPGWFKELLNL